MENKNGLLSGVNGPEGLILLDGGTGSDWVAVADNVKPFLGRLKNGQVEYSMIDGKVSFIRNKVKSVEKEDFPVERPGVKYSNSGKVKVFIKRSAETMESSLNLFGSEHNVFATQMFKDGDDWTAWVYYK